MKVIYGVFAGSRFAGHEAKAVYEKYASGGFSYATVDWDGQKATGAVNMASVSGRFELEFDSRQEAAEFFLSANVGDQARDAA